jgi:NADH dehydrogenase
MLYTPLLPEVAAGAIEPRHVAIPLRAMCPHAELIVGKARLLDEEARRVVVTTSAGETEIEYDDVVIALGATARMLPIPGLAEHGLGFKNLADAIHLRNHVLGKLEAADADRENAARYLTFVFVGAGYAGVEALAELIDLVHDALPHYPGLSDAPQRWVLVDSGKRVLAAVPARLADYAAAQLERRGVEIRLETKLQAVDAHGATLSDGCRVPSETVVWTAGVTPHPLVEGLGLPLGSRGRIKVDDSLRVEGRTNIWSLGDCADVPNQATPGKADPPTCQHALRQARRLAKNLTGPASPYKYRSLGQGATLGRDKGIADAMGVKLRGGLGALFTRAYHVYQLPLASRRLRVVTDGALSARFGRDMAQLGVMQRSLGSGGS